MTEDEWRARETQNRRRRRGCGYKAAITLTIAALIAILTRRAKDNNQ